MSVSSTRHAPVQSADRVPLQGSERQLNFKRQCADSTRVNSPPIHPNIQTVPAALTLPWSTSPVEGHITRLKLIKRQGYGRCGLATLKHRFLRTA